MTDSSDSAFVLPSNQGCVSIVDGIPNSYGYVPSMAAGIVFLVLFGLSMVIHVGQTIYTRTWFNIVFAIGALVEVLGWAGRTWSAECPYNSEAFLMQISTLIIAPTFFTAGIYYVLGQFIYLLGKEYSPISPKRYLYIFCSCDFISLVIQAVGGALASSASNTPGGDTAPGTHTMVAGIVFQMATITVFVYCFIVFLWRCRDLAFPKKMQWLMYATVVSMIAIYVRSIYRTIELSEGWSGFLITHEPYFIVLDGALMVVAVGIYNIFYPGWLIPTPEEFTLANRTTKTISLEPNKSPESKSPESKSPESKSPESNLSKSSEYKIPPV